MLKELNGKKVVVVGMGTNNQKLVDFLRSQNTDFQVVENWKDESDLFDKIEKFDVLFRTPGLPYLSEPIARAMNAGVEISSQTKLFFQLCRAPIIGVTGTKGKGTTSSLIAKILETGGKKVWLAGNIGKDPFEFIDQIKPEDWVVLELSSFQLQDMTQSPHIAVVLSVTPDHLNHHHDFEEYIRAKSQIVAHQTDKDFAILHSSLPDWFQALGAATKIYIDPAKVEGYKRKLLGGHNLENIAAAASVAKILEIPEDVIIKVVEEFQPLLHRLQIVSEKNGIIFVDDSISTNAESTIAAIKTFDKPLIAILGGSGKGLDYVTLGNFIKSADHVKAVIVIGEEAPKIINALEGFDGEILTGGQNMNEIFKQIKKVATSGDVVLLSPAAASFGMFKDYKDRGEQFIKAVNEF